MKTYFAPGRVNLIGEHLDYNGGLVLPAAINLGVTATYKSIAENKIVFRSTGHSFSKQFDLNSELLYDIENNWTNYPLGVVAQLIAEGHLVEGCEITFESNLPEGSGLSSSAAVEIVTAFALLAQSESNINLAWLANFCKQVENEFIGVKCGIMDQYSVALGKKDCALLLDCKEVTHQYIPVELSAYRLMIMDTCKPRSLVHSKYNERKAECDAALKTIQLTQPEIIFLADADFIHLDLLADEVIRKRARHVLSEQMRVKESVKVLELNDLSTFGRLMNASHQSLRSDYEVTGLELDTLVDAAQQVKGCLGARMTGAGFGGCAIALVHESAIETFTTTVSKNYLSVTGMPCKIYETQTNDGVHQIT